jgi:integral membrane sensor domain MASE1
VGLWAIPLLELALVVPARLLRGRSPLRGSPDHFSLRLQDQGGWSKWRVLAISTVLGSGFAAAPWVAAGFPPAVVTAYALGIVLVAAIAWLLVWRIPPRAARVDPATRQAAGAGS